MGKLTICMLMFNSYVANYQRVKTVTKTEVSPISSVANSWLAPDESFEKLALRFHLGLGETGQHGRGSPSDTSGGKQYFSSLSIGIPGS